LLASFSGLLFSLYLSSLEAFILHAWCVLCLSSQLLILAIFILCGFLFMERRAK
jgi:uncharacterized membrane protein